MAVATSQLKIQLQGAKSISDLEAVLQEVNGQLKDVDINSDSFKELSTVAKTANASVREIQTSLEGVTGAQQADAAFKLGEALVGGFAIATVASSIFGEEAGESIEQATQTAAELLVALDGVKKISEAFTSENIRGLRGIVQGFKASTIGAKLFGTTTKAALTATGIGILVIAVGTLIANFDAVVKAVKDFANSVPFLKGIVDTIDGLIEKVGSLGNLFSSLGAGIKGLFTVGTSAAEEFNRALSEGKEAEKLANNLAEVLTSSKDLSLQAKIFADRLKQQNNEISRTVLLLQQQKQLTNDKFKQDEIELEIQEKIKDNAIRIAEIASETLKTNNSQIMSTRRALKIEAIQLKTQIEQEKSLNKKIELREKLFNITQQINNVEEFESLLDAKMLDGDFQRLKLEFNLLEKKKEQVAEEKRLNELLAKNLAIIKDTSNEADKLAQAGKEYLETQEAIAKSVKDFEDLNKEISDFVSEFKEAEESVDRFQPSLLRLSIIAQSLNKEIREAKELYGETSDEVRALENAQRRFFDEADQGFNELANNVADFGFAAVDALGVIGQFVRNDIDRIAIELDKVSAKAEESAKRRSTLEDQLKDSAGDRFDFILKKLQQEQAREKILQEQKLKQESELREAKTKAAQLDKAQAVAISIVQTLLATITALPNLILAGIVGSIGAAATIAIGATPIPEFAEGGYTGKGLGFKDGSGEQVAGVVHSDEYVVPKHIVNSAQGSKMISSLEAMRLGMKGYAEGGSVGIPDTGGNGQAQLSASQLVNALSSARFQVAVSEFNRVSNEVSVIEDNSSF